MQKRTLMFGVLVVCGILGGELAIQPALAQASSSGIVSNNDTDNDQTLDLAEVKTAASARFDKLNKDSDQTLDATELKGVIGSKTFSEADPDKDGTLTKDEYLALVEKLFKKADVDHDGTLSVDELGSHAALALKRLID